MSKVYLVLGVSIGDYRLGNIYNNKKEAEKECEIRNNLISWTNKKVEEIFSEIKGWECFSIADQFAISQNKVSDIELNKTDGEYRWKVIEKKLKNKVKEKK